MEEIFDSKEIKKHRIRFEKVSLNYVHSLLMIFQLQMIFLHRDKRSLIAYNKM